MHADLADEYMAVEERDMAAAEFQTALKIYPDYPDVLANYGLLRAWKGEKDAGGYMMERAYYMSQRDNPNYDFMAVNYAALLMQTGHMDGAMDVLNREIAESPSYARAWANRAVIHYKQGQTTPARNDAEKALQLDPANTQAQNLLRALSSPESPKPKK